MELPQGSLLWLQRINSVYLWKLTWRIFWSLLQVNFEEEPRKQFLTLLGYDPSKLAKKVRDFVVNCTTIQR